MKTMTKILLLSFTGFIFVGPAYAQQKEITGTVIDATTGEALPGASINIKATYTGAITDLEGKFNIKASKGDILSVSFIGYLAQEIEIGDQESLDIQLSPNLTAIDEVVVIGYSTVRKSNITGAVSMVEAQELAKLPVTDIDRALSGKVAGVRVNQATGAPGDAVSIRIRGVGTIGNNDPLYVIDGIPADEFYEKNATDLDFYLNGDYELMSSEKEPNNHEIDQNREESDLPDNEDTKDLTF